METKKLVIFTLIAAASASHNYETSGRNSWQGSNAYSSRLPSVAIERSSLGGWSRPSNSLGGSISTSADKNRWSGIYRYGINRNVDSYSSQRGWPRGQNSDGTYSDNQRNSGWTDSSTGWNDVTSRSRGGWNEPNARSDINNGWQSSGW
ncbi:hypothetical protein K1T71_008798 [Dendrolimus kikuchii]|uniref:Uncharacterized protein n=1 Tax=Dendrolimus kikuchii TaxID=765133 RepID=A0ACC1CVC9_9NEOP|nr:hypothetical protein K1T71_008798 [Dendrolimus kikuchii]